MYFHFHLTPVNVDRVSMVSAPDYNPMGRLNLKICQNFMGQTFFLH